MSDLSSRISETIRDIPDFPKAGIIFKDITPVLANAELFGDITRYFAERYTDAKIDQVVGIESRGFIFGAALAQEMGVGLTLIRKPGKLPHDKIGVDYALEYGTDRVELHTDALHKGDRVIVVDDLLATGGTASAALELIEKTGATVEEVCFVIELAFLEGRERLGDHEVHSLVTY